MPSVKNNTLHFDFTDTHGPQAKLSITLQRTLRIPDDGKTHHLPPDLGRFPVRLVDDFADKVPSEWLDRGGVMIPMYQSEAMWLRFTTNYKFAVMVAAGKVNALTGEEWGDGKLAKKKQNYMVAPNQPWIDGFCVEKNKVRQFVSMPLGDGYTVEEQVTGKAEFGGLQILVVPMKKSVFEKLELPRGFTAWTQGTEVGSIFGNVVRSSALSHKNSAPKAFLSQVQDMGLAQGGTMRQEIYKDPHGIDAWDTKHIQRCYVHMTNSMTWQAVTGSNPPHPAPTAADYTAKGLPWFDYYDETAKKVTGSKKLAGVKTVKQVGKKKGVSPLPENVSVGSSDNIVTYKVGDKVTPGNVKNARKKLGLKKGQVRDGAF